MNEKDCPLMKIFAAIKGSNLDIDRRCQKENCEFWTKRKIHISQTEEYGCAIVLSVQQRLT